MTACPLAMQLCARCNRHLPMSAFHPGKRGKAGHYCRACHLAYRHERYGYSVRIRPRPRHRRTLSTGYRAVHKRVQRLRGPASDHPCQRCDAHQAEEWAYDHADPHPITATHPRSGRPVTYSLDPAHYLALCKPCHAQFDARSIPTPTDPDPRPVTTW